MTRLLPILFFLFLSFESQKDPNYNKQGRPSIYGIDKFIKENQEILIKEYEYLINDTIYELNVFVEDLSETSKGELGIFYPPDNIVLTDVEAYVEYEFKNLSKFRQRNSTYVDRTVKAVLFHELTHAYIYQIEYFMTAENKHISFEYRNFNIMPINESSFGADFIEEGICEYMVYHLKEAVDMGEMDVPESKFEVMKNENNLITYRYSAYFLKDFLDNYGIHKGIEILVGNKPPSYEEIFNPKLFFNRIK